MHLHRPYALQSWNESYRSRRMQSALVISRKLFRKLVRTLDQGPGLGRIGDGTSGDISWQRTREERFILRILLHILQDTYLFLSDGRYRQRPCHRGSQRQAEEWNPRDQDRLAGVRIRGQLDDFLRGAVDEHEALVEIEIREILLPQVFLAIRVRRGEAGLAARWGRIDGKFLAVGIVSYPVWGRRLGVGDVEGGVVKLLVFGALFVGMWGCGSGVWGQE